MIQKGPLSLDDAPARQSRHGSETRARSQVVQVRCTPEEYADFAATATELGKSVPELMRLGALIVRMELTRQEVARLRCEHWFSQVGDREYRCYKCGAEGPDDD